MLSAGYYFPHPAPIYKLGFEIQRRLSNLPEASVIPNKTRSCLHHSVTPYSIIFSFNLQWLENWKEVIELNGFSVMFIPWNTELLQL